MKITYRRISTDKARALIGSRVRHSKEVARWEWYNNPAEHTYGAFNAAGKLVGMVCFEALFKRGRLGLESSFTWVHYQYRCRGIGVELWRRVVTRWEVSWLSLKPVTPGGKKLVERIREAGFVTVKVRR